MQDIRVEVWEEDPEDIGDDQYVTMDWAQLDASIGDVLKRALDGTGLRPKLLVVIGVRDGGEQEDTR